MDLVSVIIVNWNGRHLLDDCLQSVLSQTYKNFEIIVVDNNSHDDSVVHVATQYPSVKIVPLRENTGFTGGNIEGLKQAQGDYIALLNNDTIVTERWLEFMVSTLADNDTIGFCSSKIIIAGTDLIDSVGDCFTTAFNGTKIGEYEPADLYGTKRFIPGACAAAVMYKRTMLDEIGFLDDDFFFNHEDTDLNVRAWLAGWKCVYVPEAIVYHKVSASLGTLSDLSIYYFSRNTEWVWVKNIPFRLVIRYLPQKLFYEFISFCYFGILKRKYRSFLRGKFDAVWQLRKMLKKRRSIQQLVRLTDEQVRSELMPISEYVFRRICNLGKAGNIKK